MSWLLLSLFSFVETRFLRAAVDAAGFPKGVGKAPLMHPVLARHVLKILYRE